MKNLRYNNICLRALTILCLMMASVGAWAEDYVLAYINGNTTYYLARNGTTGVTRTNTFNPTTCIWSCENANGNASTLNNSNTYGYLYQTVNNRKYYLYADVNAFSLKTDRASSNYSRMRTNGTYVYNRYSNTTSYYINLANTPPARNTTAATASNARPYAVDISDTDPSLSVFTISGGTSEMTATGSSPAFSHSNATYTPAGKNYRFNDQDHIVPGTSTATINYSWSLSNMSGYATVSNAGVVTYSTLIPERERTATLTCTATAGGLTQTATTTIKFVNPNALYDPSISYDNAAGGKVAVTLSYPESDPEVKLYYTTNGGTPSSSSTLYTAPFEVDSNTTIKVIAVKGSITSGIVSAVVENITPGVSGGKVVLDDRQDHSWTLFQAKINGEDNPIYYANPKDVKITYKANGGAVSISESADQFVYYKTLTDDYKYTTIPNPFSKRPRANGNYQGFSKWKITSISGGTIAGLGVNSEVNAETELTFNPTSEYGMTVEFEVVWTRAYVVECAVGDVNANLNSSTLAGDSYETNFIVITSGTNSTTNLTATTSKKVTITMVTPDGATDYRAATRYIRPQTITLSNDWKFEYINMNNNGNGTTITANNHNLVLGRGISNTTSTGVVAGTLQGVNAATNNDLNYHIRMESGRYTNVDATMQGNNTQFGGTQTIKMTVGCDYDRANNEDNTKLYITDRFYGGNSVYFTNAVNKSRETLRYTVKSGTIHTSTNMSTTVNGQFYFGIAGWTRYSGKRTLIIEGGNFHSISGGLDYDGNDGANSYAGIVTSQYANADDVMVEIQMRGGTVRGSIYGAAQFAAGKGIRKYVFTGGTINGWVAGGCNGTNTTGGQTYGSTQIYVGGNNHIIASNANPQINSSYGGNVFGAGSGIDGGTTVGQVNNSTLVVADQSIIGSNVFGGGNYGYVMTDNTANTGSTKIYVTGGTVRGKVFGGSNQQQGQRVNITMTGGIVEGGLYGGSNVTGTINQNVVMNIVGGQVGTSTTPANINGGGLGTPTRVTGNVDLTIGGTTAKQPLIYGSVYGGSESGYVNGTAYSNTKHTYVTMNNGYIHGSLYGGGNGAAGDANVYGNVLVTVDGGSVSEAVYGCNNSRGAPQGPVDVIINGTDPAPAEGQYALKNVFGGGNAADYTYTVNNKVYPTVTVNNCDNSIEYVYGGGNAATVPGTDVTIHGGNVIGNVFGGGYGANITTKGTKVTIDGGTILNVYGGSNSSGTITGGIAVNINEASSTSCPINIDNVFGGGNRAASDAGTITIGCASHIGSVYGGANQADVTSENVNLLIEGGNIDNVFGGNNLEGNISGTITVTIDENKTKYPCGMTVGNVFGGGNLATLSKGPTVNILNGHITGNVFGGGKGDPADHTKGQVTGNPTVTIGTTETGKTVTIDGDVYGGGDAGNVVGTPVVTVVNNCDNKIANLYGGGNAADVSGTNVTINGGTFSGMVFGGGHGDKDAEPQKEANVKGDVALTITGGTISKVFAGSNSKGAIEGTATLNVDKGVSSCDLHITELYGGGNEAAGNAGTINIKNTGGADEGIGTVYGGANNADINSNIALNITGGNIGDLFGGNNNGGQVRGDIEVNVNWTGSGTNKLANVYGGGNIASIDNDPRTVTVNIKNATTTGSVFGGGKGKDAVIVGTTNVNIGDWQTGTAIIGGDVFGGGDLAAVEGDCNVTIRDCNTLINGNLYGGGNAAPVYETNTTVWGGTIKKNLFGGGNGEDETKNPNGAQIGYKVTDKENNVEAKADEASGDVNTNVYGGTIGTWTSATECADNTGGVFGGSNTRGDIKGEIIMSVEEKPCTEDGASQCTPLKFKEIYGAGNLAAYMGEGITFNLGCVENMDEVYGGAKQADLRANVKLNLTSGHIKKVFGGNNISGALDGTITVQIDETGCNPLIIDDLYLGGNKAAYSVYGYNDDGSVKTTGDAKANPVLNIVSATSIGRVFGGGLGETATIVGNPVVNVNMIKGMPNGVEAEHVGTIGTIFGGGDAAPVQGSTTIYIGTEANAAHITGDDKTTEQAVQNHITGDVFGGGLGETAVVSGGTKVIIEGDTNVEGNVYGGGNAAEVEGTTTVKIGNEC